MGKLNEMIFCRRTTATNRHALGGEISFVIVDSAVANRVQLVELLGRGISGSSG